MIASSHTAAFKRTYTKVCVNRVTKIVLFLEIDSYKLISIIIISKLYHYIKIS